MSPVVSSAFSDTLTAHCKLGCVVIGYKMADKSSESEQKSQISSQDAVGSSKQNTRNDTEVSTLYFCNKLCGITLN